MKIDLHVHSLDRSPCALSWDVEQVQAAIQCGLDAFVLTEHDRLVPQRRLAALNEKYAPFRVFGGAEITLWEGEHALVLGIHDPALETMAWTYPKLHDFVRAQNGWLALAHPFRFSVRIKIDIERYRPDAMEACSINIPRGNVPRIRELAEELGIPIVCNSDAHRTANLGAGYNLLDRTPEDERDLIDLLKAGAFRCICQRT